VHGEDERGRERPLEAEERPERGRRELTVGRVDDQVGEVKRKAFQTLRLLESIL
jgi:hypothetical protein